AGTIDVGSVTTVGVGGDLSGTIIAHGAGTIGTVTVGGDVSGVVAADSDSHAGSGHIGLVHAHSITGNLHTRDLDVLQVTGAVAGSVDVLDKLGSGAIGSIAGTGSLAAGTLSSLSVSGAIAGNLSAANVGTLHGAGISANGTTVFKITQAGVERRIVAIAVNSPAMPAGVTFDYFYDGTSAAHPQAAVRVTNGSALSSADDVPFDLELITSSASEFDLARLDANGTSGIRNVVVEGNVLAGMTAAMADFLQLSANAPGGVRLAGDKLNGVFAEDNIQGGTIATASIQAVSFGSVTTGGVTTLAGSATSATALSTLAAATGLAQARGTYVIPFSESQKVAAFLVTGSTASGFDGAPVLLTDQIVDNQSLIAVVKSTAAAGANATIQSIDLYGNGGAIQTAQWIQASITSTGPLGDLILSATQGITAHVQAPTIIGNIDAVNGPIAGVIETTVGDIGRVLTDASGKITGVTYIHGRDLSGKLISRGNLVSAMHIDGGMSGLIAVQGDFGAIQRTATGVAVVGLDVAKSLTRFGGLLVNGSTTGNIVVLGNVFGDLQFNGSGISGRVAVHGQQVAGLDAQRYGILGRVTINGNIGAGGAIVSGGVIGDDGVYVGAESDANGTQITFTNEKGILAAENDINYGKTGKLPVSGVFENATGVNKAAIDAIFTDGGKLLTFDTIVNGKSGLDLILGDLAALRVGADGNLTGTVV
ncbi:MAG: hypothetical protein HY290_16645, partial [Planctomycetia bacterium]|nr:hypothetical protein [Planctomycetia bacterium]